MTSLLNAVQFAATSSGTGDFVVSSAIQGFQTPSADGAINGETYSYRAQNASMSEWEIGIGTWNSGTSTLARTTILASSTGSKVSFTAAPNVGLTPSKSDLLTTSSFASQAQAEAGTNTTTVMNPLRTAQAIAALASMSGAFVGLNLYTSSQTITILGTKAYVRMVSSAGGSAGLAGGTDSCAAVGTCGSYLEALLTGLTVGNTLIYTQGAVGSGASAGDNAGGNAGSSTLASGTETISTLTCPGGNGGPKLATMIATATSAPTGGIINLPGVPGLPLRDWKQTIFIPGKGVSPPGGFGVGGPARVTDGSGLSGSGYGASAGGPVVGTGGSNTAGTAGRPGALEITWFS